MRTVFCQKPCCQGTQVWTQQVQGLHPHPPQQPLPSKVCRPGMTGPALGHQAWATATGRSGATARSGAWLGEEPRKSPPRWSLLWPPVPPPGSLEAPLPRAPGEPGPLTTQCTTQTLPGSRRSQPCMFLQRLYRLRRLGARRAPQPQSETCREGGSPVGCRRGPPHTTRHPPPRACRGLGSQAPPDTAKAAETAASALLPRAESQQRMLRGPVSPLGALWAQRL